MSPKNIQKLWHASLSSSTSPKKTSATTIKSAKIPAPKEQTKHVAARRLTPFKKLPKKLPKLLKLTHSARNNISEDNGIHKDARFFSKAPNQLSPKPLK